MEISNLLSTVQEKIDNIDTKLDGYNFESIIENSKNTLIEEISSVKESISGLDLSSKLSEEFAGINQKLDIIAMVPEAETDETLKEDLN